MMGTKSIVKVAGKSLDDYAPSRFYSDAEIKRYLADLVRGRITFTEEITAEGLDPEIVKAAEKSFGILRAPSEDGVPAGPVADYPHRARCSDGAIVGPCLRSARRSASIHSGIRPFSPWGKRAGRMPGGSFREAGSRGHRRRAERLRLTRQRARGIMVTSKLKNRGSA